MKCCVVRRINNQVPTLGPAHEQRCAHMISKGTSTKSEANSYSCKQSAKKPTTKDKTEPLSSQRVGLENG